MGTRGRATPVCLNAGSKLYDWIEAGGVPERQLPFRMLRHRWSGYWFDKHESMTARHCAAVEIPDDPVFIVGLWRTGSTVLHTALQNRTGWTTPRTWQCFRPADFFHAPTPSTKSVRRPMDMGLVDTNSPQEDEFASLLLGEETVYRAFIDPRRFAELERLLVAWQDHANHGAISPLSLRWESFLRAVLARSPERLLLKSPNHTFRLPWISRRFPRARFIWIVRPEKDVLASNHRMWGAMIERYGQWYPDSTALERFLRLAIDSHAALLDWARRSIADRMCVIAFDDVLRDREITLSRILHHLAVERVSASA